MSPAIIPLVRRAVLDLLCDIGGEHNHAEITILLNELGHRLAHRDVIDQLAWLTNENLIQSECLGDFVTARILTDGRDVADGRLTVEGVSIYKTGE
jgi:hypothetical protein